MNRFRNMVRYAPVMAGIVIVLAVVLSQAYQLSARTQHGAPTGLAAAVVEGGVSLSWEAPAEGDMAGYRILRRYGTENTELVVLVEDTGSVLTGYVDGSVRPGTEYVYRVQPVGPDGAGALSNYVRLKTPALSPETMDRIDGGPVSPVPPPTDQVVSDRQWSMLRDTETTGPDAIVATSEAFWVINAAANRVYAFDRSGTTVTYNSSKNFDLHSDNGQTAAAHTDGTTLWVLDSADGKVYAYVLTPDTGETRGDRVESKEFDIPVISGNRPLTLASDGTTAWACYPRFHFCLAHVLVPSAGQTLGQRVPEKDFQQTDFTGIDAGDLATDGTTIWVTSSDPDSDDTLYAYALVAEGGEGFGDRTEYRDIELDSTNNKPQSIVFEDGHVYVANGDADNNNVYAYLPPDIDANEILQDIQVDGVSIPGFYGDAGTLHYGVAPGTAQVTVEATARAAAATVSYDPDHSSAAGAQVDLSDGANTVTITVTRGSDERDVTLSINRGVETIGGWAADHDIDTLKKLRIRDPRGIWGDGNVFYVLETHGNSDPVAHRLTTEGSYDEIANDFRGTNSAGKDPYGIWSDGTNLWVVSDFTNTLHAHELATLSDRPGTDIMLHSDNAEPRGVWGNSDTIWVSDSTDTLLYAYSRSDKMRDIDKDIDLHSDNGHPGGIWSERGTMWVLDTNDTKIYAYKISDKSQDSAKDIDLTSENDDPIDIWADEETMWVTDEDGEKVYAYNRPPSDVVLDLTDITVDGDSIPAFSPDDTSLQHGVAPDVTQVTVAATALDASADVEIIPSDAATGVGFEGHQVDLQAGANAVTITVTVGAESRTYNLSINRGVDTLYGWAAQHDIDTLDKSGNNGPRGIWGNSDTFYIADFNDVEIYAYNRDGTRNTGRDIAPLTDNGFPNGIWSDGTTLWVADSGLMVLRAYTLSNGNRDSGKDIDLGESSRGVWGNDTTVWAVNTDTDKLEAYVKSNGNDDNSKDIDIHSDNDKPRGIWSDGTTMWVADSGGNKLYAYTLSGGARDSDKDIDTSGSGNENPRGVWGEGGTIWVTDDDDDKVYAYNLPSPDASLRALTVSPGNVIGFESDRRAYEVGVASSVTRATVTATTTHPRAMVAYSGTDADSAPGHQVDLSAGSNEVTVTVTAEDTTTEEYTVSINRGVTTDFGWKAEDDFDGLLAADIRNPSGIWSNGTTVWVIDRNDRIFYAYNLSSKLRDDGKDIVAYSDNAHSDGLWSDGTTLWVLDASDTYVYAYNISSKSRDDTKEIDLHSDNDHVRGIWSDGTTMWVADSQDDLLYAYNISSKSRDDTKEIDLQPQNSDSRGIWSDGTTMWVADGDDEKLYAYSLSGNFLETRKEFDTLGAAGNTSPDDIWSDGRTMWVVNRTPAKPKIFSYNMPSTIVPDLTDITVDGDSIPGFSPGDTSPQHGVGPGSTQVTVDATPLISAAVVVATPDDADTNTPGHQVDLSFGANAVTITVMVASQTRTYNLSINRGVSDQYGWAAQHDRDTLKKSGNDRPRGIWANTDTVYISDFDDDHVYAYNPDGSRDSGKDISLPASGFPNGIWSDGTTIWVADSGAAELIAYTLSNGDRDSGSDIDLSNTSRGVWGNSTTVWAANDTTGKLEAYVKSNGNDDDSKDITLDSDNDHPAGIWSDGTTIWVADYDDEKLYAYTLSGGSRDSDKDIDTSVSGNDNPRGVWGEGETIWVTDDDGNKVYAYNLQQPPLPTAPANFEATASGEGVITLTWDATDDFSISAYQYRVRQTAGMTWDPDWTDIPESDATTTSHAVSGPINGIDYTYELRAENIRGDGASSSDNVVTVDNSVVAQNFSLVRTVGMNTESTAPYGIAVTSDEFWLLDEPNSRVRRFARTTSGVSWDSTRDFEFNSGNDGSGEWDSSGMWTDGTTLWVVDEPEDEEDDNVEKVLAYTLADGSRDSTKDFDLDTSENNDGRGIWSDGTTIWVADLSDDKLYAYQVSDKSRDSSKDIALFIDDTGVELSNNVPFGIASDGVTMWVVDRTSLKVFAYILTPRTGETFGERAAEREITLDVANDKPFDVAYDSNYLYVANYDNDADSDPPHPKNRVFAYDAVSVQLSADATLSSLTVGPKNIIGFAADRTSYEVGVASTVTQATVTAEATHENATVAYSGTDADSAPGHQVDLSAGRNEVTITVTAENTRTTEEYTVSINRGVTTAYGWKAEDDLDGLVAAENTAPVGFWSDSRTIWVGDSDAMKIFAYRNFAFTHDSSEDFVDLDFSDITISGIWSDGTTMWVADSYEEAIHAYNLNSKARDSARDFTSLDTNNTDLGGIWSDGITMWLVDTVDLKLFAYKMSDKTRDSDKDIDLAVGNLRPSDIWSDGITMWVDDDLDDKLFAYSLETKARDSDKEFDTLSAAGNTSPFGMWSDGSTMWVVDALDVKVYSFNMPLSSDANLSALEVSPRDIIGFSSDRTSYEVGVASTVIRATVRAFATHENATVEYSGTDADSAPGHQVDLSSGRNEVTVTVTAEDSTTMKEYTVSINRGVTDAFGWAAHRDLDGLIAAGNTRARGIYGHSGNILTVDFNGDKVYAYNFDGSWDSSEDFDLDTSGNPFPNGAWSDGTTLWIADSAGMGGTGGLRAYNVSTGARDSAKDFEQQGDHARSWGVWGNATTLWVVDPDDDKVYAYNRSDKSSNSDDSFDLDSANSDAYDAWSDGRTIWVSDEADGKLYAYTLSDGSRDSDKDIDTSSSGNAKPRGVWGSGSVIWATDEDDDKLYAYNLDLPAPVNLRTTPGSGRVMLEWDAPSDTTIRRYQYRVSADGGSNWNPDWTNIPGSGSSTTSYLVTGLANGTEHTFQVRGVYLRDGENVQGPESEVRAIPHGALRAPANLTATPTTDGEIALEWDDPSDATIEGYQYRHRNPSDTDWNPDWTDITNSDASTTTHTLTGLTNFVSYTFEVRAKRDATTFGPAARRSATPRGPLVAPANFEAESGEDRRVRLSWDRSNDDSITVYQYRYRTSSSSNWDPDWEDIPGSSWQTSAYTVRSLLNRVPYTFEVRAKRGNLEGPVARASAEPEGPPEVPGVPRNLSVDNRDGALSLGWQVPAFIDPRAPVTSNLVRHREQGSSRWTTVSVPRSTSGTSYDYYEITNLTNRRHYEVQVAAVNRIGTGAWVSGSGTPQGAVQPPPPVPTPTPTPPGETPTPPDDEIEIDIPELNVGSLAARWTDGYGSEAFHPDSIGVNVISNSCVGTYPFKVFWSDGNEDSNRTAAEYQAHIQTNGAAGAVSHQFRGEFGGTAFVAMYGTASLNGRSYLSISIRGRYTGQGWGEWSPRVGLYCQPE